MVRLDGMCLRGQDRYPTIPQHHQFLVARLEKRKRILCRFNLGSSRMFRRLPFLRENRIIKLCASPRRRFDIGTGRKALIGATFRHSARLLVRRFSCIQVLFSAIALVKVSYLPASLLLPSFDVTEERSTSHARVSCYTRRNTKGKHPTATPPLSWCPKASLGDPDLR